MKIPRQRIDGFVAAPDPNICAVLAYGPDTGAVSERLERLARKIVPDANDPFRIVQLTPANLAEDPARLSDEAAAISFGGGRRVVLIRGAGDGVTAAFTSFLAQPMGDALILVAAGELTPRSSLRRLFEGADNAAAIACYPDEGRDLSDLIRDSLGAHKLSADEESLDWMAMHLGGDRMIVRSEIEKLALYMGEPASDERLRVRLEDVRNAIGDVALIELDDLIAATAGGNQQQAQHALDKMLGEGTSPITILRALSRHFQRLHLLAGRVEAGMRPDQAVGSLKPPPHFRLADQLKMQLPRWPARNVAGAMNLIENAEIECKTTGMPAPAILGRAVLQLTRAASRK